MADPKADPTALLERWIDAIPAHDLLVVDPPGPDEALRLAGSTMKGMRFACSDFGVHRALDAAGLLSTFGVDLPGGADGVVVYLPKGRARVRMRLQAAASAVPDHAPLWVVGPKRGGITSARDDLADLAVVEGVESGKHSKLLRAYVVEPKPPAPIEDFEEAWDLELGGRTMRVVSYPGVFGHGRLDEGTELLLRTVSRVASPGLDVGCGSGVIGTWYSLADAYMTLVDTDAFALHAARRTLAANGFRGVPVIASDVYSEVARPEGGWGEIISNPPFHRGFETDHTITERLIAQAGGLLAPGGAVTLVVNRFLPVGPQLERHFGGFEVLAEDARYRVVRARLSGPGAAAPR